MRIPLCWALFCFAFCLTVAEATSPPLWPDPQCLELSSTSSVAESLADGIRCLAASLGETNLDLQAPNLQLLDGAPLRWRGLQESPSVFIGSLNVSSVATPVTLELSKGNSGSVALGGSMFFEVGGQLLFDSISQIVLEGSFPSIDVLIDDSIASEALAVKIEADAGRPGFMKIVSPFTPAVSFSATVLERLSLHGGVAGEIFYIGELPTSSVTSVEVGAGREEALVSDREPTVEMERQHSRAATCGVPFTSLVPVTISSDIACFGSDSLTVTAPCIRVSSALSVEDGTISLTATGTCVTGVAIASTGSLTSANGDILVSGVGDAVGILVEGIVDVGRDLALQGISDSLTAPSPVGVWVGGTQIRTSSGNCFVSGSTTAAASGNSVGVLFQGSVVTGNCVFDIEGSSGPGVAYCEGVVFEGGSFSASALGVEGIGGSSLDRLNVGIQLRNNAVISSGAVAFDGTGGGSVAGGDSNHGVLLQQLSSLQATTSISITGVGGLGSISVHGVMIETGAVVAVTGVGALTIDGTSGGSGDSCYGVFLQADLSSADGDSLTIIGNSRPASSASDLVGVRIRLCTIDFAGPVSITGVGGSADTDSFGIELVDAGIVSSAPVAMNGTADGVKAGAGVNILSSSIEVTGVDWSIVGVGGVALAPAGAGNIGVLIADSQIRSPGSGTLQVEGQGGDGTGAHGIHITDNSNTSGFSGDGAVMLTGSNSFSSFSASHGVYIDGSVKFSRFSVASITGVGALGSDCHGVVLDSIGIIIALTDLSIVGTGGGTSTGTSAHGVVWLGQIMSAPTLSVTGTGGVGTDDTTGVRCAGATPGALPEAVTVVGFGGAGLNSAAGVEVLTSIKTNGTITITGTGGTNSPSMALGVGIQGDLEAEGLLSITGTGTASSGTAEGILFSSASTVTSAGMSLNGRGGSGVSGSAGVGIKSGSVFVLSTGDVVISGTGGTGGPGGNVGIYILTPIVASGNFLITAVGGDAGAGVSSTGNHGLYLTEKLQGKVSIITDILGGGGSASVGVLLDTPNAALDSPSISVSTAAGVCDVAGSRCHGFQCTSPVSFSGGGTIQIQGSGSSQSSGENVGVLFEDSAAFDGEVIVFGFGGQGSNGQNVGVMALGSLSGSGNGQFVGQGGNGASRSHGIELALATINFNQTVFQGTGGGDQPATGSENHGIIATGDGVFLVNSPVTFSGSGGLGQGSTGVFFTGPHPFTLIDASVSGRGGVSTHATVGKTTGVVVDAFLFLVDVSMTGFGGAGPGNCHGVDIQGRIGAAVTGGTISITGWSGGSSGSSDNIGVRFTNGGFLVGNSNTVTVTGVCPGGDALNNNIGVYFEEDQAFGQIDLTIDGEGCGVGTGGAGVAFTGVTVDFEGRFAVNGTGSTAGVSAVGVSLDASIFLSPLNATLYSFKGVGNNDSGIAMDSATSISNTAATVELNFTGESMGSSGSLRGGLFLKGPIASDTGGIRMDGSCDTSAQDCSGIIAAGSITSGSGVILLRGVGGTGDDVVGVDIMASAPLSSSGSVSLEGSTPNPGSGTVAVQIASVIASIGLDVTADSDGAGAAGFRRGLLLTSTASLHVDALSVNASVLCEHGFGVEAEAGASVAVQRDLDINGDVQATSPSLVSTGVLYSGDLTLSGDSTNAASVTGTVTTTSSSIGLWLRGTSNSVSTTTDTTFTGVATCTAPGCTGLLMDADTQFTQSQSQLLQFTGTGTGSDSRGIVSSAAPVIDSPSNGDVIFEGVASGSSSDEAISLPGFSFVSAKTGGLLWFNGPIMCPSLAVVVDAVNVRFTGGGLASGIVMNTGSTRIESSGLVFGTDSSLDFNSGNAEIAAGLDASGSGTGMRFSCPVTVLQNTQLSGDNSIHFFNAVDGSGGTFDLLADVFVEFKGDVGSVTPLGQLSFTGDGCLLGATNMVVFADDVTFSHSSTCTVDVTGVLTVNAHVSVSGTLASVGAVDIAFNGNVECVPFSHPIMGSGVVTGTANIRATMDDFTWSLSGVSVGDGRSEGLRLATGASFNPGPSTAACYEILETFDVRGTLTMDLDGSNSPCASEDRFVLLGATIVIDGSASLVINGSPTLLAGDRLFLTDGAGATSGAFAGLPEHSAVPGCSGPCIISYLGSSTAPAGFDIVLTGNSAPVAIDDVFNVSGLMTTSIAAPGVLLNDGDPDSADVLVASLMNPPAQGAVLLFSDGSFTFDPTGVLGPTTVTFTYTATDDFGASDTATVVLNVGPNGPSPTPTSSPTASTSVSPFPSDSASITPSQSSTETETATATRTPSTTQSLSSTRTPTASLSASASPSITATATASITGTPSGSLSLTATTTNTPTASKTATASETSSPTPSSTVSQSPTSTLSLGASASNTPSTTSTASVTATPSETSSETPSSSISLSSTSSPSVTAAPTGTSSTTRTASASETPSATSTTTQTASLSNGASPSNSATGTATPSPTQTQSMSGTALSTVSLGSASSTPSATASNSATPSSTRSSSSTPSTSSSRSKSGPVTPSNTASFTAAATPSSSATTSATPSATQPGVNSASASRSKSVSMIIEPSAVVGPSSIVVNNSPSSSLTASRTPVPSIRPLPVASRTPIGGDDGGSGNGGPLGSCDFESITVGSGTTPTTVNCGDGGGTVVTVLTTTDVPIVISPGDPVLIAEAGLDDVVSAVVDVRLLDGTEVPDTEICLRVSSDVDDNSCLAFIDESLSPPEWRCEDSCLTYDSSTAQACGNTDHFTNFAILLDGGSAGGSPCDSSDGDFITGVWWGDLTLAASTVGCMVCCGLVFVVFVSIFPPARKLFLGDAGYQAVRMRTMTNAEFRKSTKLEPSFNSEAAFEGNI